MALIKTALELALERTRDVEGDPASVAAHEARQRGKKLAGDLLDPRDSHDSSEGPADPAARLAAFAKALPPRKDKGSAPRALAEGALEVFVSQIKLPERESELSRLELVGKGLSLILDSKDFNRLFAQLSQAFSRFLEELAQYEELIVKQYAPKLRQKEEEIARRTGRAIALDPMQDPEFLQFRNQHIGALRERYESAVEQVRAQARELFRQQGA